MTSRDAVADPQRKMESSIIGQRDVIRQILVGLPTNGHVLLEGLPGLAKTGAVKSLAKRVRTRLSEDNEPCGPKDEKSLPPLNPV